MTMTDPANDAFALAAEFPAVTHEQWRKLVEDALGGASFERVVGRSYDDLPIEPLYARKAAAFPARRSCSGRTMGRHAAGRSSRSGRGQ